MESKHNEVETTGDSLYLSQLTYKPKDGKTFLNFFIKNFRVTVLIIIGLLVWGLFSFQSLTLESNPEVKIPFGVVAVTLPGASPADVEELVIQKIEPKIASITGVKQITSNALNSLATISVEFRAEEDLTDAIRRLREAVDLAKADLPTDASDPVVREVSFSNAPVWTVVVTGPYDNFALRDYADKVKDELEKLPGTNEVLISGGDIAEAHVVFKPERLQAFSLSIDQVNSIIRGANIALPLGTLEIANFEYTVRVDARFQDINDLQELAVGVQDGQIIRLKDVAEVNEQPRDRDVVTTFSVAGAEPENAVTLNIVKKTGSSIIDLIDDGKLKIEDLKSSVLPADVKVETTLDMSKIIRRDFDALVRDGILTVILVSTILFLFVGLKEAFVAGLAVPLVFCATFGIMYASGQTLNFLSLFSLILSLGLLVDDAIVVVQATKQYLKTGKFTPEEAVLLVFRDFKVLLTTTTLTTLWAFMPLVLATGIIGEFIRSIPVTVSIILSVSYLVAIIINHPMAIILERFRITRPYFYMLLAVCFIGFVYPLMALQSGSMPVWLGAPIMTIFGISFFTLIYSYKKSLKAKLVMNEDLILQERADRNKIIAKIHHHYLADASEKTFSQKLLNGVLNLDGVLNRYAKILRGLLVSKFKAAMVLVAVTVLFLSSLIFPATGILKSEFLAPADAEYMYINIEAPQGLITEKTEQVADQILPILLNEEAIQSFTYVVGAAGVDLDDTGGGGGATSGGQTNRAQFAVNFYPLKERPVSVASGEVEKSYVFAQRLRQLLAPIQGAKIEVVELAGGPPSGSDFEARIVGDSIEQIEKIGEDFKGILATIPGAINTKTSIRLSPGEFTVKLDQNEMRLKNISATQIASTLRSALTGSELTKIFREGDDLDIIVSVDDSQTQTLNALKTLLLTNPQGQNFLLSEVADVSLGRSLTSISRIDQKRAIVVSASVEKPYLPAELLAEFQKKVESYNMPDGYSVIYGGQNDTNTESILSILRAMIVAMVLIIGTLVVQFNSFRKSVLVLASIPLALTGVFWGLTVFGFTLSFPSLIGILALFGIVVKNAIILVDKINLNLNVGIGFVDSIIDASSSRLEAIFLTSISTIIGMLPLTLTSETWQGLGLALIFGLISSTFLTLFVIPILYNLFIKGSHKKELRLRELKALIFTK